MDSDIDLDIPVRIKPVSKPQTIEPKSPLLLPYQPIIPRSQNTVSPSSNYSVKSSKEKIDIPEIRRILTKLKSEIEHEKRRNQDLIENNIKELNQQRILLESQHSNAILQLNVSFKHKLEESTKKITDLNTENIRLNKKIVELTNRIQSTKAENQISNLEDAVAKITEFCNCENKTTGKTEELMKIISDLNYSIKCRYRDKSVDSETYDTKITKLRTQNTELMNIVKVLDRKLKTSQKEIVELTKKLEQNQQLNANEDETDKVEDKNFNLEMMLKRAISERLQLEKQLTWLQKSDDTNPATRERVEVLTKLLRSLKKNQKPLEEQLSILKEKSENVDNLVNEISVLKTENEKLSERLLENSENKTNLEELKHSFDLSKSQDQVKSIKIKSLELLNNEYRKKLIFMDRLLKRDSNSTTREDHSEDSTETLKAELRELEKRCTQQALNYEEALLELETLKKTNQRYNLDFYQRNGSKEGISNSSNSTATDDFLSFNNDEFGRNSDPYGSKLLSVGKNDDKIDSRRETAIFGISDNNPGIGENERNFQMENKNNDEIPNNDLSFSTDTDVQRKHIPAPIQIKVENHPNQKNTRIVRWKCPEIDINIEKCVITSYHIYVDGHFYKGVNMNEQFAVALPNLDLKKSHRIVIRSVCPQGQSKDAQCTIEIGSFSLAPSNLKANKITGTSAQISWVPSNSNWRHSVWVNGNKYCDCLPGIYKIVMQGLTPDSLQKVQVHPFIDKFVDNSPNSNNCSYLDFQTLPMYTENFEESKQITERIESPKYVKLKLGNRPGRFIVKWVCPQQITSPNIKIVGYSIFINNQCIALVNGAKNDQFNINLHDLKTINPPLSQNLNPQEQSFLPLTVKTMATVTQTDFENEVKESTIYSKDSQPVFRFSGQVAARIAGTAAEAAIILGDRIASFLNLQSQSPRSSKEYLQAKISVPKIQITKDSSFSEDDENPSMMPYRNKSRQIIDQYGKIIHHQKNSTRNYGEYKSKSNSSSEEPQMMKNKNFPNSQTEKFSGPNQWSPHYNSEKTNSTDNERYNYMNQKPVENIRYFVALFDYDPATMSPNSGAIHEELPFKAGQNIKVFGQVDEDGFYTGETNGRRGLVPSNMVNEIDVKAKFKSIENSDIQYQERSSVPPNRNKEPMLSRSLQGKLNIDQYPTDAQLDYQATQQNYQYNDYSQIHRKSTDSAVSYAASDPNSYQRSQVDNYIPRQSSAGNSRSHSENRKMLALYDYDPQTLSPNVDSDAELAFKCNDIIEIIGEIDEDGFFMGKKNGQTGLVPSNFLTDLPLSLENRTRNPTNYQNSFDNSQPPNNQYKDRNFSSAMNFSDPPSSRDNRTRNKPYESERSPLVRNPSSNNGEYIMDREMHSDNQKNNPSFEESFDSGPSGTRTYGVKQEPKNISYNNNNSSRISIHDQMMDNKGMQYPSGSQPNNKMPNRSNKPITDRRTSHDKTVHRPQPQSNIPPRDLSPPPPLEADDMPIVMDLAPSKENQKKKKVSSNNDNYRSNMFENHENYGNNENLYVNSNSVMSDNLERKRSVFKNPFKKKKS